MSNFSVEFWGYAVYFIFIWSGRQTFANLMINNSKGRQSLGESPSPNDCVGVSRQ
ncbi:MAG: hypothetical protein LBU34_15850 [Planctomycetaceae bacterium]|nr:hypothetical protein [Planctomycetaceae bacterium]